MNKKFAYFLGILHDAHVINRKSAYQYGFEIEQKNKRYTVFLASLINELFGVKPKLEKRQRSWGTYWRLRVYSKKVYEEIVKHDFKKLLNSESKAIKRELIRGLFDAEGSVSIGEVRMFNNDTELLETARAVLSQDFGLRTGRVVVSKDDVWQLPIYAKADKKKFMDIFRPNHPDKILRVQ